MLTSRSRPYVLLLVFVAGGITVAVAMAQPRSSGSGGRLASPEYDYVGVGESLVRVERASGRIEILEQPDAPGLSLTHEQRRPWRWRAIRLDERPERGSRPSGERDSQRPQGFGGRYSESED